MKAKNWLIGGISCIVLAWLLVLSLLRRNAFTDFSSFQGAIILANCLNVIGFVALMVGLVLVIIQKPSPSHSRWQRWYRVMAIIALVALNLAWMGPFLQIFTGDVTFWIGYQKPSHPRLNQLEQLLKMQRWQEANTFTTRLIRETSGTLRKSQFDPTLDSFRQLPCADFQAMDQLWVKQSNGQFGFSVQRQIFESIEDTVHRSNPPSSVFTPKIERFLTTVGSKGNNKRKFNRDDPSGALPTAGIWLDAPFSNESLFSTQESVNRQKWCGF